MSGTASMAITVFRGWDTPGKYVWSTFVTKLEARLRFSGVKYTVAAGSMAAAPRSKVPYMECQAVDAGAAPVLLSDTALITKDFIRQGFFNDLNATLSPTEKALDASLKALLEEKLYWYLVRVPTQASSALSISFHDFESGS
jgi:hypothetical protein